LSANQTIERTIRRGESHPYRFNLKAKEYLHVDVNQRGIDVQLVLVGADGRIIVKRDRPNGVKGKESLSFVATTSGEYRLEVNALGENPEAGKYQITREVRPTPTIEDKKRVEAETLFQEGTLLSQSGGDESVRQASAKYEAAAALWREVGDKYAAALTQTCLGQAWAVMGKVNKAIVANGMALTLYRELRDTAGEAETLTSLSVLNAFLNPDLALDQYHQAKTSFQRVEDADGLKQLNTAFRAVANTNYDRAGELFEKGEEEAAHQALAILAIVRQMFGALEDEGNEALTLLRIGRIHSSLGEKQLALDYYQQALPIWERLGEQSGTATTLNNIGLMYSDLGKKQKALDYFNQALNRFRGIGDKSGEATTLNNLGLTYADLGERRIALTYYGQALPLRREVEDKPGEATTLDNIGLLHDSLGEKQRALDHFNQGLLIWKEVGDKVGEAKNLNNIGFVFNSLGERRKALDYYNRALVLLRVAGNKAGEATILNNIGGVFDSLGEKQKALDYYNQALPIRKTVGDQSGQATTLSNIGLVYDSIGEKQRALDYYNQALPLRRETGDNAGEATTLNNIGGVYDSTGERQKALDYYHQALLIWKTLDDKSGEGTTLGNIMFVWSASGNPRLATLYGKQSVNAFQLLRGKAQELKDGEIQKTFLRSVEETYRKLTKLLIEQGRLPEALQVLNSFKDQQYFDRNPKTRRGAAPIVMTERETELSSYYEKNSTQLIKIEAQIEDLKITIGNRTPSPDESAKLRDLGADRETATRDVNEATKRTERELTGTSDLTIDKSPEVFDTREMQSMLQELNVQTKQRAVAIYTLVSEDSLWALIVTPQTLIPIKSLVKSKELNQIAEEFLRELSEVDKRTNTPRVPQSQVEKTGKQLYDLVFARIAARLKELNINPDVLMWSLDGVLRYIPLAALYDGKQFLAERYRNVVFTRPERKTNLSPVSKTWTGSGFYNSNEYSVPVNGEMKRFPSLEKAKLEVETIFGVPPAPGIVGGDFLSNELFTKDNLLQRLRQHRPLVHIASHFRLVPGDATSSFLLLGDGNKLTLADLNDEPDDLFQGVELLTLSACETGVQKERESDRHEIDSLAELAQHKQAQAIIASLWDVDDLSTSRLMLEFYQRRQLKNLTKAEALQEAQLNLLNDARYSHPFYWSPFILIGNWR
jgi:CHAT domain-containing protein/tetratricopeptide (TPR) repeat protein